jgi:hypothetical protein
MNPILKKTILTFLGVVGISVSMTESFLKLPDNYLVYELHLNMIRRGVLLFITFWLMWYIKVPKRIQSILFFGFGRALCRERK